MDFEKYKKLASKQKKELTGKRTAWLRKQFQGTYKTPEGFITLESILSMCDANTSSLEVAKQIYDYLIEKPDYKFNLQEDVYDTESNT